MKVVQKEFTISTEKRTEIIDITEDVENIVSKSGVKNGLCNVFVPHATAAIMLNENEVGLVEDIVNKIKKMFPKGAGYRHDRIDNNADSHLVSGFIGQSKTLPVKDGELLRGSWQQIFLVEADGPRGSRRVVVSILGE